jgi:hypothetical protein
LRWIRKSKYPQIPDLVHLKSTIVDVAWIHLFNLNYRTYQKTHQETIQSRNSAIVNKAIRKRLSKPEQRKNHPQATSKVAVVNKAIRERLPKAQ